MEALEERWGWGCWDERAASWRTLYVFEETVRQPRRAVDVHRVGAARQDDRLRVRLLDLILRRKVVLGFVKCTGVSRPELLCHFA